MAPEDPPVPTEYPPSIGRTARRALALDGYTTYAQLTRVTAADLLRIHGVGPKGSWPRGRAPGARAGVPDLTVDRPPVSLRLHAER